MTPKSENFTAWFFQEAVQLRRYALKHSSSRLPLDQQGAFWVIKKDAWKSACWETLDAMVMESSPGSLDGKGPNKLMGLPVRLTVDDAPDAPIIVLAMEPALWIAPK